jgi:hypothetical protein
VTIPQSALIKPRHKKHRGHQMAGKSRVNFKKRENHLPSGKRLHNCGKITILMGKSTISMVIFNSFLYVYQRVQMPEALM